MAMWARKAMERDAATGSQGWAALLFAGLVSMLGATACSTDEQRAPSGSDANCEGAKCDDGSQTSSDPSALTVCVDHPGAREIREEIQSLLEGIVDGSRSDVNSIAAFVAALPQETRENLMFMTHSRALARVHTYDEQRRLMLDTRPSEDRVIDPDTQSRQWCLTQDGEQTACVETRVLMVSKEADFVGSFTSNPASPSEGHFELSLFDPDTSEVTLFDLDFNDATPVVTKNPDKCMMCHQGDNGDINLRFDPYRAWSFITPFNEDNLRAGSVEAQWYLSLLRRIEDGAEPDLAALEPLNTLASVEAAMNDGTDVQLESLPSDVRFGGADTPGLNIAHQFLEKNACRTAKSFADRPDFEQIKYAALGGMIQCENLEEFWPTEGSFTREDAEAYFARRREGQGEAGFDLRVLQGETRAMQARLLSDKLSRRFDHFSEFVGPERAWAELEGSIFQTVGRGPQFGISNFESSQSDVGKVRYMLEPLGVDVAQWSMAVDREHHAHVDFFRNISAQPVFIDVLKREFDLDAVTGSTFDLDDCKRFHGGNSCLRRIEGSREELCGPLAERSREALLDHVVDPSVVFAGAPRDVEDFWYHDKDDVTELEQEAASLADATSDPAELRSQASGIYRENCTGCHDDEFDFEENLKYSSGVPVLPLYAMADLELLFSNQSLLEEQLEGDEMGTSSSGGRYEFEYISMADRIWDRITRHPLQHGTMPFDREPLSREDKVIIRAHMIQSGAAGR